MARRHGRRVVAIVIVIASSVLYHLAQKAGASARPWPMLTVAYGVAFVISLVLNQRARFSNTSCSRIDADLASIVWGASPPRRAELVEPPRGRSPGRRGLWPLWPLASVSVIANVAVTVVLAAIGMVMFGEHVTAMRAAGIVLAMCGGALIVRGVP